MSCHSTPGETDGDIDDDVVLWNSGAEAAGTPTINEGLQASWRSYAHSFPNSRTCYKTSAGRTHAAEYCIRTKAAPVRLPPYRLPHAYRDTVRKELEEMEKDGIIERSGSEWAFPIILEDGTLRMCVDYRRLNAVAEADAYPMPRVDDLIDSLGKAKFVTTLDLSRGYWQVPVEKESRPYTAFTTPYGFFQFRVMPFGLHGAPATFQRMMGRCSTRMPSLRCSILRRCCYTQRQVGRSHGPHPKSTAETPRSRVAKEVPASYEPLYVPGSCRRKRGSTARTIEGRSSQVLPDAEVKKTTSKSLPRPYWILPQVYSGLRRPRRHSHRPN